MPERKPMQLHFSLEYWQDGDWYVGRLKGVPGVFSQGKTVAELAENIRDAYHLMMQDEGDSPEGTQVIELTVDA
jgi:predicted RNase H-like HicB family nuclease